MGIFYNSQEWFKSYEENLINFPMHYVGEVQKRSHKNWLARFDMLAKFPGRTFWSTADLTEIRASENGMIDGLRESELVRTLERPHHSLAYVVKMIEDESPEIKSKIAKTSFGIAPDTVVNAGVQPSPCGGNAVILQDGIFMSPWAYGKIPDAMNAMDKVRDDQPLSSHDKESCYRFLEASLNVVGLLSASKIEAEYSKDTSEHDRVLRMARNGRDWPESEVYGDGASWASSMCGFLAYFIVLHEIGHIASGHCEEMRSVLQRDVTGNFLTEEEFHQQEYEADAFAVKHMLQGGRLKSEEISGFLFYALLPLCLVDIELNRRGEFFSKILNSYEGSTEFAINGHKHLSLIHI